MQKSDTQNTQVEEPSLLPTNKVRESLKNLDGWQTTDDHKRIYREFILHNFMAAVDLIDHIAFIAEDEKHHPDIHLTQYRNLRVALTTHDAGGLTEKDFIVAQKINDLPLNNEHQQSPDKKQASHVSVEAKNQPKSRKSVSLAPKKNNKATGIKAKKVLNRMDQRVKKA